MLDRIAMILGGRVAEELIYGKDNVTTGASNDLEKVSALAKSMVTSYGMSDKMGNLAYGKEQELSGAAAGSVDGHGSVHPGQPAAERIFHE